MSWACHAYGEGPCAHLCFFTPSGRYCGTEQECETRLTAERVRLFEHIRAQHEAHPADPLWAHLAADIDSPDTLLGGSAQSG